MPFDVLRQTIVVVVEPVNEEFCDDDISDETLAAVEQHAAARLQKLIDDLYNEMTGLYPEANVRIIKC